MSNQIETRTVDTSIDTTPPAAGSLLDSLIANYAPKSPEGDIFYAELPKREKLKCRKVTDGKRMKDLQKLAAKYGREQAAANPGTLPEAWRAYHVDDQELYARVWLFSRLVLEPDFHQNELASLRLARECGPVFNGILEQIDKASCNMLEEDIKELLEAGNA